MIIIFYWYYYILSIACTGDKKNGQALSSRHAKTPLSGRTVSVGATRMACVTGDGIPMQQVPPKKQKGLKEPQSGKINSMSCDDTLSKLVKSTKIPC